MLHMYKNPNILVSEKQITQFVEKQAKDLNRHFTTQATRWLTSMWKGAQITSYQRNVN